MSAAASIGGATAPSLSAESVQLSPAAPDAIGATQDALQTLLTRTTDSLYWAHASALPDGHLGRPPPEECSRQLASAIPDLEAAARGLLQSIDAIPDLDLDKSAVIARLAELSALQAAAGARLRVALAAAGEAVEPASGGGKDGGGRR